MAHKPPKHGHYSGHHDHDKSHVGHPSVPAEHASETTLHQRGMIRNEPNAVDASTHARGPTVDQESTRSSVAPTPGSLGPRAA